MNNNEDSSSSSNQEDKKEKAYSPHRKSFFERLGQLFQGEVKDRQELVEIIRDSESNDLIDVDTKDMLEGVMRISEILVHDVMLPRSQMVTLERSSSLDELVKIITTTQHSRYPVTNGDNDHVEGILLAKDLLQFINSDKEFNIESLLRPAFVVSETKRIDRLLKEFRQERYHMAIVVDEFGGVSGVITIEDILEEIVGDIDDEFDNEDTDHDIRKLNDYLYVVRALTTIADFNESFGTSFNDEEVDTIGGMVMTAFGRLPSRGDEVEMGGYLFRVTAVDNRRIIQLQIVPPMPVDELMLMHG